MIMRIMVGRKDTNPTIPAKTRAARRRVVVLAVPPVEELDVVGTVSVFNMANNVLQPTPAYAIEVVAPGKSLVIAGESGVDLVAHVRLKDVRGPIDTLLVAGGVGARLCDSKPLFAWLRRRAPRVRRIGSVCTGSFVLAAAGLLDGRAATTHWAHAQEFAERHPLVKLDPAPIWVRDENVFTSAGITAGMDLALALVERDHGSATALAVARYLVLYLRRPGGQAQFSVALASQKAERDAFRELPLWIAEHLRDDLSVQTLADHVAMSDRHFARLFAREMGTPPARYVERARLEEARRNLELTSSTIEQIADRCGFTSAEVFRRAFLRTFATNPREYRERFRTKRTA